MVAHVSYYSGGDSDNLIDSLRGGRNNNRHHAMVALVTVDAAERDGRWPARTRWGVVDTAPA